VALDALQMGLRRVASLLGDSETDPEVRRPGFSYHEAGGLGMGESAETSVTDPFGRFWACENLVACDASAWPTTGATNPHITIAAVARRNALGAT
jgi:choline dehydrogenase-like flavoprotein